MMFDFEPSGINDTYLRLSRSGASCIMTPAGAWNGILRTNYIIAGTQGGNEPFLIFRAIDVGWDDGRFSWKGRARPVTVSATMADILVERGMVTEDEAERLLFNQPDPSGNTNPDAALMVRALIAGCSFTPIYDSRPLATGPARVTGFALRTLADPNAFILEADAGMPVLTDEARKALAKYFSP